MGNRTARRLAADLAAVPGLTRDLAARSYDRDDDRNATGRQLAAILASGNRTRALRPDHQLTLLKGGETFFPALVEAVSNARATLARVLS